MTPRELKEFRRKLVKATVLYPQHFIDFMYVNGFLYKHDWSLIDCHVTKVGWPFIYGRLEDGDAPCNWWNWADLDTRRLMIANSIAAIDAQIGKK